MRYQNRRISRAALASRMGSLTRLLLVLTAGLLLLSVSITVLYGLTRLFFAVLTMPAWLAEAPLAVGIKSGLGWSGKMAAR